jgi:hypothetical protein
LFWHHFLLKIKGQCKAVPVFATQPARPFLQD